MTTTQKALTAADLWQLSHEAQYLGRRLELSEGQLIVMSPAGFRHGLVYRKFIRRIDPFVDEHQLGITTPPDTGYILHRDPQGGDIVRAPDIGFIAADRVPKEDVEGFVPFAPDLAVEVVSPNDTAAGIQKKVLEYLTYGTKIVWVVYADTQTVEVHTPQGARTVGVDGVLDGGAVLPGFTLAVSEIFGA